MPERIPYQPKTTSWFWQCKCEKERVHPETSPMCFTCGTCRMGVPGCVHAPEANRAEVIKHLSGVLTILQLKELTHLLISKLKDGSDVRD